MIWLTHLRTIVIALGAFTLCCGLVTQMLARALGYDAALGPPLLDLGSVHLYAPFSFLSWSVSWAPVAPSLPVLSLCLALVCALAAYAVAIVFAKLEPIALAEPSPWRDLASWRDLGHYGLLRDEGLALGAARCHAIWEMVRVARAQRAEPDQALADLAHIDQALALFADAKLLSATSAHHLDWAELVSSATPRTLVLSLENTAAPAAPLVQALLAQLATHHSSASDAPPLMLAIEAGAARLLVEQVRPALPIGPNTKVLIQSTDIAHAECVIGAGQRASSIVAIGPQTEANAQSLSNRGGYCTAYGPIPFEIHRWRRLLFPAWVKQEVERLPTAALKSALPSEAFLVAPGHKPVRMAVLVGGGATCFMAPTAPARHDWSAPPVDNVRLPEPLAADTAPPVLAGPTATKLRRVLARTATKPANKGARTK